MHPSRRFFLPLIALAILGLIALAPLGSSSASTVPVLPMAFTAPAAKAAPARCSSGPYVWAHLTTCGWPGPANTGPRTSSCPSNTLKNVGTKTTHVTHIRRSGRTISCQRIVGCLSIEATNVTVRDVAIRCTSGRRGENANGTSVISVEKGASATVSHVSINGMRGVHACVWDNGKKLTIAQLNCKGVNDGVFSWSTASATSGNHFSIKDSYFHDFTSRTANGHIDGYQTEGASYGVIQHNTYLMTSDDHNSSDSAIAIWDSLRSSHDITVKHNLISGGGFSIYAHDYSPSSEHPAGGYSVKRIKFVNNVFSKHLFGCVGSYGVWFTRGKPTDGWHRTGNTVLEGGGNIDSRNPVHNGRLCT